MYNFNGLFRLLIYLTVVFGPPTWRLEHLMGQTRSLAMTESLSFPQCPVLARAQIEGDFRIRGTVKDGHVKEVRLIEGSVWAPYMELREVLPSENDPASRAFLSAIREAVEKWTFRKEDEGNFEVIFEFRLSYIDDEPAPRNEYLLYRVPQQSVGDPPKKVIVEYHVLSYQY